MPNGCRGHKVNMDTQTPDTSLHGKQAMGQMPVHCTTKIGTLTWESEYHAGTFDRLTGTETRNVPKRSIRLVGCRAVAQVSTFNFNP